MVALGEVDRNKSISAILGGGSPTTHTLSPKTKLFFLNRDGTLLGRLHYGYLNYSDMPFIIFNFISIQFGTKQVNFTIQFVMKTA